MLVNVLRLLSTELEGKLYRWHLESLTLYKTLLWMSLNRQDCQVFNDSNLWSGVQYLKEFFDPCAEELISNAKEQTESLRQLPVFKTMEF